MPKENEWSKEDTEFLCDNVLTMSASQIGLVLGRSAESVKSKRERLELYRGKKGKISVLDDDYLREHYPTMTLKNLAAFFGVTPGCITKRVRELKILKGRGGGNYSPCSEVDREFIRQNRDKMSNQMMALCLRRSKSFVEVTIKRMGLKGKKRIHKDYDPELVEVIKLSKKLKRAIDEQSKGGKAGAIQ